MMTVMQAADFLRQTVVEVRQDDTHGDIEYVWSDGNRVRGRGHFGSIGAASNIEVFHTHNNIVKARFEGYNAYQLLNMLQPLPALARPPVPV